MQVHHRLGSGKQIAARVRKPDLGAIALEKAHAQLLFQGADAERHRPLRAAPEFRCDGEAPLGGHGQERPQEPCVDISHEFPYY